MSSQKPDQSPNKRCTVKTCGEQPRIKRGGEGYIFVGDGRLEVWGGRDPWRNWERLGFDSKEQWLKDENQGGGQPLPTGISGETVRWWSWSKYRSLGGLWSKRLKNKKKKTGKLMGHKQTREKGEGKVEWDENWAG